MRGGISQFATPDYRVTTVAAQHGWSDRPLFNPACCHCLMPLLSVALWKHFVYIFFGGFEKRVAAGVEVRKLTPAKHRPPAELQSSFWMRWLPLNRCLPHTASEAPWCDAAAFSHQPHWCIDDANDRTTLYTLFKYQMMKERLHLGRDLFIFLFYWKIFSLTWHTLILGLAAWPWEQEC